ncbi:MAG: hypothetical protein GF355_11355 [Candidatus Eisenbacteria bacterium]|nr:hypothetical protein [Candidatus Eisenbacteria bacterium]
MSIMSAAEAQQLLNDHDLVGEWSYFLDSFATSGIPDANTLARIGEALDVDCIIQGEIVNVTQRDGVYGGNKGTTRVTVRYSMLDTRTGKLVWEASSDGVRTTATTVEPAPPIIEAVNLAVDRILTALPEL